MESDEYCLPAQSVAEVVDSSTTPDFMDNVLEEVDSTMLGGRNFPMQCLQQDQHPPTKRRREDSESTVIVVSRLLSDGYSWRKYGQKEILGFKYPRGYFRCTFRHSLGCYAIKMVQRVEEHSYQITYRGAHTCTRILPGNTCPSHTTSFKELYGIDVSRKVPIALAGKESFGGTGNLFCGSEGTSTLDTESETFVNFPETPNTDATGQIRQEDSIISTFMESSELVSADLMFSANNRTKKDCNFETNLNHHCLRIVEKEADFDSWPTGKSSGSTDSNVQRLLSVFQDVEVKKIGLYGTGGIGKTTVMKAFASRYDLKRLFDLILWVTIPRHTSRRKIQNALLLQLSLDMPTIKSDDEVAMILHQTLLVRKFVLFLDDVWEYLDLSKVGIPVDRVDNDYKIILTARSIHIFEAMEVDKIIKAENLSREESLQLFRFHVGHIMDSRDIEPYARAIVEECSGLPLAIKVAGGALRMENSTLAWKHALKEILLTNDLQVLKFGYDRLKEYDMRSFLYCAMFTESKAVRVSSLVGCLVDEGFVAGRMSDAHTRGHDVIKHLVDVSLLECGDDGLMVGMHSLICELALVILSDIKGLQMLLSRYFNSILSRETFLFDMSNHTFEQPESSGKEKFSPSEGHLCILRAGEEGLTEPPSQEEWEEAKMVFLMDNALLSLPKRPACSKLLLLFLQRNSSLRALPSSFFENMSSLQILNLSRTRIKSLPPSLSKLECLQVLILRNCERLLFLPSEIGALKHLLVLDVHGTEICQLPDQIEELLCLVHLQVHFYGSMDQDESTMLPSQLISKGIISKLIRLRELRIVVYPGEPRWTKIASDVTAEVSSLNLCSLSFYFPEIGHLEYFINASPAWLHRTLAHFNFIVGHDVKRVVSHVPDDLEHEYNQQDRCLRFVDGEDIPDPIKRVLSQATSFYLDHHLTAHSLTQFGWDTIKHLKFCIVRDCPKLRAILNSKKLTENCFKFLEILSIHYCWNLSRIWVGPIPSESCSMLRRLSLHSCPKLEFILSPSMVAVFPKLEELIVVDCQSLTNVIINKDQIFADDDTFDIDVADSSYIEEDAKDRMEVDPSDFTVLRIKVMKLHYLPKLVNIWDGGDLPWLEYVSLYDCPRLKNHNLKSHVELTLKEVKAETALWNDLEWEDLALPAKLQGRFKEIRSDDIWGTM